MKLICPNDKSHTKFYADIPVYRRMEIDSSDSYVGLAPLSEQDEEVETHEDDIFSVVYCALCKVEAKQEDDVEVIFRL